MADFPSIPEYTIHKLLGKGGMGAVYLARQDSLNRYVALKVTLATLGEMDESFAQRFVKEARTTASLRHPNIITIYESGEVDGRCFMSMEYIEGGTMSDLLEIRRLSVDEVIDFGKGVCAALNHAHRAGFVHRDIKPENIMLGKDGEPVVTDFGIVKSIHSGTNLTGTNATVGSPQYMSPEQLMGDENIDGRADLYSLGVVLFEMLEGRPPFDDDQDYAVGMKHLTEKPPPLSPLHDRFQPLLDRLLQKNPDQRFASALELSRALEAVRSHHASTSIVSSNRAQPGGMNREPRRVANVRGPEVKKASLRRRMGSSVRMGRIGLGVVVSGLVLIWAIWLRDVEIRAVQYELQGIFGTPMDRYLVGRTLFDRGLPDRARFWMSRAMDDSYPGAAYELGRSFRYQDEQRAVRYLQVELANSTHDENDRNAAMLLSHLLCNGGGTEDCQAAIDTLAQLNQRSEDPEALYRAGEIYFSRLVPPEYDRALEWFERAANSKAGMASEQAMMQIAKIYDEGLGVSRQRRVATRWWVRAASMRTASFKSRKEAARRCEEASLRADECDQFESRR